MLSISARSLKTRLDKLESRTKRTRIKVQTWPPILDIDEWELEAVSSQEKLVMDTRDECVT